MIMPHLILGTLLLLLGRACALHPPVDEVTRLENGSRFAVKLADGTRLQVQEFPGANRLELLRAWEWAEVVVECNKHKDFYVYSAPTVAGVRAAYDDKQTAWCGWDRILGGSSHVCRHPISPFGPTVVGVAKPRSWYEFGGGDEGHPTDIGCSMERRSGLSMARLLSSVLGTFLFLNAPVLSASTPFRLTGGTLSFMALSMLVLLFVLYRKLPHKKAAALGTLVVGSGWLALVRRLFGTVLPWSLSWGQVLTNPFALAYLALTGLTGLGLTYWYNNPYNAKVNTMLNVALHLVGLGMVAAGPNLPLVSAAWAGALLGYRAWTLVRRYRSVGGVFRQAQQVAAGVDEAAAVGAPPAGPSSSFQQQAQQQKQKQAAPAHRRGLWGFGGGPAAGGGAAAGTPVLVTARGGPAADYEAAAAAGAGTPVVGTPLTQAPEISPLVQRGLVLNEDTGHLIHIGKATYNRLVASGYEVDRAKGVITPPPPAPGSPPAGSPRGSGRGGARRRRVT